MPPILVPSSAKRIATQTLVIAKLNERSLNQMILFWEALSVISFVPPRNYLFKVSNSSTKIICIKATVMQVEKALTNDRLRVSKVS